LWQTVESRPITYSVAALPLECHLRFGLRRRKSAQRLDRSQQNGSSGDARFSSEVVTRLQSVTFSSSIRQSDRELDKLLLKLYQYTHTIELSPEHALLLWTSPST
jgi:hypothetical protein